jgi:hypothetical protein
MTPGYVYILTDNTHPYIKIGRTTRTPEQRIQELSATGMPGKLKVFASVLVGDCAAVEAAMHKVLARHRVRPDREFFDVDPEVAWAYLSKHSSASAVERRIEKERQVFFESLQSLQSATIHTIGAVANVASEALHTLRERNTELSALVNETGQVLFYAFVDDPNIDVRKVYEAQPLSIGFYPDEIKETRLLIGQYEFEFDGERVGKERLGEFDRKGSIALPLYSILSEKWQLGIDCINHLDFSPADAFDELFSKSFQILRNSGYYRTGAHRMSATSRAMDTGSLSLQGDFGTEAYLDINYLDFTLEVREEIKRQIESRELELFSDIDERAVLSAIEEVEQLEVEVLRPLIDPFSKSCDLLEESLDTHLAFTKDVTSLLDDARSILFSASSSGAATLALQEPDA